MNQEYFKTKNGTELPILNLKGKPYLQVAHRIQWFREEHPEGRIETNFLIPLTETSMIAVCKAKIYDGEQKLLAEATKREDMKHFQDFIEKCETGAIGRALALCGYGTQFAEPDFDEVSSGRLVDSPILPAKKMDFKKTKEDIKQAKEAPMIAPNPILQLQEAAKINAWTGEQMRTVMIAKMQKMLVKDLSQAQVNELCEIMKTKTFTEVDAEMKGSVK